MRTFEKACGELQQASDQIKARYELMSPTAFTCIIVNRAKMQGGEAFNTVHHTKGARMATGDISYVHQRHAAPGTSNGWFSVKADDHCMFLAAGMDIMGNKPTKLTAEQAATELWDDLVRQAGIDYE